MCIFQAVLATVMAFLETNIYCLELVWHNLAVIYLPIDTHLFWELILLLCNQVYVMHYSLLHWTNYLHQLYILRRVILLRSSATFWEEFHWHGTRTVAPAAASSLLSSRPLPGNSLHSQIAGSLTNVIWGDREPNGAKQLIYSRELCITTSQYHICIYV